MIALAVAGSLLYGVVFSGFFKANLTAPQVMRTPPGFLWIGLSHIPFGILLTGVIAWRGATSAAAGARVGAILGFLMAATYDLAQYGTSDLWTLKLTLIEPFIAMVLVGVAGAVVGLVLGHRPARAVPG
jgi:hypothetical protein